MGEVIHVQFGTEREWNSTREKLVTGLRAIGQLFGDDPDLMEAKADCAYQLLRQVIEDVPCLQIQAKLPSSVVDEEQTRSIITDAIKEAALKGIETALTHAVQIFMASIYDLCTSKLAQRSRQ
jgi:hypothetical protein